MAMKALKCQLQDLCELHKQDKKADQPDFPNLNSVTLSYIKSIKPHLYLCSLDTQKVVTKFVEGKYGIEVHRHMAAKGYAPKLVHCKEQLTSRFCVFVMN